MTRSIFRHAVGALFLITMTSLARADTIHVRLDKLAFAPTDVTAHVGDTVEWVNSDFVAHTATARDGSWDILIPTGGKKSLLLKTVGTVEYYCKFHPNMTGRIVVSK